MFVSNWEDDDEGIVSADMSDTKEQFLLAAENGDLTTLTQMHARNPLNS